MPSIRIRTQHIPNPSHGQSKPQPPRRYAVVLLNDDYTPMDFVVSVLTEIFLLPPTQASAVMLLVHHEGRGVCGVYQKDIAQSKCRQVHDRAQAEAYPLKCVVEAA